MNLHEPERRWGDSDLDQQQATWNARYGAAFARSAELTALHEAALRIIAAGRLASPYRLMVAEHVWGTSTWASWLRCHPSRSISAAPVVCPLLRDLEGDRRAFAFERVLRRWHRWLSPDPACTDWHIWDALGENPPVLPPPTEAEAALIECLGEALAGRLRAYQRDHEHEHRPIGEAAARQQARALREDIASHLDRTAREQALASVASRHGELKRLTARYRREYLGRLAALPPEDDAEPEDEGDDG